MPKTSPAQQLHEAKAMARKHGMFIADCKAGDHTDYVLYRSMPSGKCVRLGKRSSIPDLRRFVLRCAETRH